jgi:RimJ/RimL family protein N-acetyltransferase
MYIHLRESSTVMYRRSQISFRALLPDDLPQMFKWLTQSDISRWYSPIPETFAELEGKYSPRIHGYEPVNCYIVEYEARPVGYIQSYRIDHEPQYADALNVDRDAVGVDLFIGDETFRYHGFGPVMLQEFVGRIVFSSKDASCCVVAPSERNYSAIRAYQKAGFRYVRTVSVPDTLEPEYVMMIWPDEIDERIAEFDGERGS